MKKPLIIACVIIVICSLLTVSLLLKFPFSPEPQASASPTPQTTAQITPQPTPANTVPPNDPALAQAVTNGVNYARQIQESYGLLMLNVLYRQFGVPEFNDSLQRYDQLIADNSNAGLLHVFRRMASADVSAVQPEDFNTVTDQYDRLTVPALYADSIALPDDYLAQLTDAIDRGGYMATHALLATIWLQNNHATLQLPENFTTALYQTNAALIGDGTIVDDLQLEAAAFLYQAGQGNLVNSNFIRNVINAQFTNGGWSPTQDAPYNVNWHASVLGVMILLYVQHPATSYPPMIPPS